MVTGNERSIATANSLLLLLCSSTVSRWLDCSVEFRRSGKHGHRPLIQISHIAIHLLGPLIITSVAHCSAASHPQYPAFFVLLPSAFFLKGEKKYHNMSGSVHHTCTAKDKSNAFRVNIFRENHTKYFDTPVSLPPSSNPLSFWSDHEEILPDRFQRDLEFFAALGCNSSFLIHF